MFSKRKKKIIEGLRQKPVYSRFDELKHDGIKIRQNLEEVGGKGRIKGE